MRQHGSGLWAGELDGLVGRDETLVRLRELLESGSRAAVVTGIAGAGKTSVLAVATRACASDGRHVLAVSCHESERDLPFSMLVDLLAGAPDAEDVLDLVVPSSSRPAAVDALRLRLEVLAWLERASEQRPLVVVVDDAHWCDESSLSVLGFVARRLAGSSASVLAAARGDVPPTALRRLPGVTLPPLEDGEAATLLRHAGVRLDALTLPSVLERAAGNPLALLELGRVAASGDASAVPSSVEAAFRDQVAALPARTRHALLLAASGDGDLRILGRVLEPAGLLAALGPAETAGLVHVSDRRVRFRHPLVRAAAYALAPAGERQASHASLAAAYDGDPERQAWHRAEAAVVADEDVAAALAEASELALRRGASAEATRLMTRAAELSVDRGKRESRMLHAVMVASTAGAFEWAAQAGAQLRAESDDPVIQLRAAHVAAYTLAQTDRSTAARRAVVGTLEQLKDVDPFWGWSSLTTLSVLVYRTGGDVGEVAYWLDVYDRAMEGVEAPYPEIVPAAQAWIRLQIDPTSTPEGALELVRDAPVPDYPPEVTGTHEMLLGAAAWLLDEPGIAIERLGRSIELKRRADQPGEMTQTLIALALVQFSVGDYDAVDEAARLIQDIAEARNQPYAMVDSWELQARVAAVRGDVERARELLDRVLLEIPSDDATALEATSQVTMAWIRLAEQDVPGAWNEVRPLFDADGQPRHVHISYRELGTYASAAVRAGALDELERVVAVAEQRFPAPRPYHRIQLARARALVSAEDAEPWHLAAVNDPDGSRWPFEHANARLEYGAWLRRRHRPTEARTQLRAALDAFTRLGTRAWTELARAELRAAGVATEIAEPSAWADLTGQERQIVRMAASGMTNPEIAATLYLSPRTVSTHLYNAFPKLGVTSRAQLRDVVPGST